MLDPPDKRCEDLADESCMCFRTGGELGANEMALDPDCHGHARYLVIPKSLVTLAAVRGAAGGELIDGRETAGKRLALNRKTDIRKPFVGNTSLLLDVEPIYTTW